MEEQLNLLAIELEGCIGTSPHSRDTIREYLKKAADLQKAEIMKGLCYETYVYMDDDGDGIETIYNEWLTLEDTEIGALPEDIGLEPGDNVKVVIIKD